MFFVDNFNGVLFFLAAIPILTTTITVIVVSLSWELY